VKLSSVLVGISLLILISIGVMLFISDGVDTYSPANLNTGWNSSFVEMQDNLDELTTIGANVNETLQSTDSNSNIFNDFLGFFFGKGYQAAKVLVNGVKLNGVIVDAASENIFGLTGFGSTIASVGLLLIFIFIILLLLHFVVKSEWI
jgi:hypothetical protein